MREAFSKHMTELRREKGISQRKAAAELGISQAQLSHYETGAREPGLDFLCRACDYYGVSADYLLGRGGEELPELDSELLALDREARDISARLDRLAARLGH